MIELGPTTDVSPALLGTTIGVWRVKRDVLVGMESWAKVGGSRASSPPFQSVSSSLSEYPLAPCLALDKMAALCG